MPIYAGCSFLETVYPAAAVNFTTARELYEAYTLFNFIRFLMVSHSTIHPANTAAEVGVWSDPSAVDQSSQLVLQALSCTHSQQLPVRCCPQTL